MDATTVSAALCRISYYVESHSIPQIALILHGGEPLLAGIDFVRRVFNEAKARIPCKLDLAMQSNATLLTSEFIQLFDALGATIGISLDGPRPTNDRHRRDHAGRSSFDAVEAALALFSSSSAGRRVFSGILAVIDLENDPIEVYDYLSGFRPRGLDFLLPDSNHDNYPSHKATFEHTPYADWLIRLFDHWWCDSAGIPVRLFDNIVTLLLGGRSDAEYCGVEPVDLLVIETDGSFEAVDTLKTAFDGAPELGYSVFDHSVDQVLQHPTICSALAGGTARPRHCHSCDLLPVCGGGYQPHRFSSIKGYENPSVYCHDLAKLILHIRATLVQLSATKSVK